MLGGRPVLMVQLHYHYINCSPISNYKIDRALAPKNINIDPFAASSDFCQLTGPRSAVGNVSGYRCVSDCRSRGRKFDPGPVPYFRGD